MAGKLKMDVTEKLVELIRETGMVENENRCKIIAEELMQNGVTVQEWISVKDRLPETEDVFLCWSKDLADMMFCYTSDFQQMEVTHWMPLPPEPKGE